MTPSIMRPQKFKPEDPTDDVLAPAAIIDGDSAAPPHSMAMDQPAAGRAYYGEDAGQAQPPQASGGFGGAASSHTRPTPMPGFTPPAPPTAPAPPPVVNQWGAANDQWRQSQGMAPQNPQPAAQPAQPAQQQPAAGGWGTLQSGNHSQSAPQPAGGWTPQPQPQQATNQQDGRQTPQQQRQPHPQQRPMQNGMAPRRNYYGQR